MFRWQPPDVAWMLQEFDGDEQAARECWQDCRDNAMREHTRGKFAGSRSVAWWAFEAPNDEFLVIGDRMTESQACWLLRHSLMDNEEVALYMRSRWEFDWHGNPAELLPEQLRHLAPSVAQIVAGAQLHWDQTAPNHCLDRSHWVLANGTPILRDCLLNERTKLRKELNHAIVQTT